MVVCEKNDKNVFKLAFSIKLAPTFPEIPKMLKTHTLKCNK